MEKDIEINVNVPADRKITIDLPKDFPCGPAKVVVKKSKKGKASRKKPVEAQTGADLLRAAKKSGVWGMWADYGPDDSVKFVEELRRKAWGRDKR